VKKLFIRGSLKVTIMVITFFIILTGCELLNTTKLPDTQLYFLKGDSYLLDWNEHKDYNVKVAWADGVSRSTYRKEFSNTIQLFTEVTFMHYVSTDRTAKEFNQAVLAPYGYTIDYHYINSKVVYADRSKEGCHYIHKSETLPYVLERYSCEFIGQYGLCIISVNADILEPYLTSSDFEQLIEKYIDPQMADWSACYPDL